MSELLQNVLDLYTERPTAVVLMSGFGSNASAILGLEELRDLYDIRGIATDNRSSNALALAKAHRLQYIEMHQDRFASQAERGSYFATLGDNLTRIGVNATFYAGFMKIASLAFVQAFPGVNVHPADLTIVGSDGVAKYRGMNALPHMRHDNNGAIAASVHVVDMPVDTGNVVSLSNSITCPTYLSDQDCHARLKTSENLLYPRTLIRLASGVNATALPLREADL